MGPSRGASSSSEFEMVGAFLMTITPLVIKLEIASMAVSFILRKSFQSKYFGMKSLVQSTFSGFLDLSKDSISSKHIEVS